MVKKILSVYIVALCALIYSCAGTYGMDEAIQEYHPRTSRSSLFKASLVGLGLMLSPTYAQISDGSDDQITGFGGCYLMKGTIQPYAGPNNEVYKNFFVSQIRTSGCSTEPEPFYPHGEIKDISLSIISTKGVPSIISETYFCDIGIQFDVKYDHTMDAGFNMSGYNTFNFPNPCEDCFLVEVSKSDASRGQDNIVFDKIFSKFMNTGDCFDTSMPTPYPTRPTRMPTPYPTDKTTIKPTNRPTSITTEPTTHAPTSKPTVNKTSVSSSNELEIPYLGMMALSLAAIAD